MTLTPAYGRDYKSSAALLADFNANKDFVVQDHKGEHYINKEQITKGAYVLFRYGKLRKVLAHKVD